MGQIGEILRFRECPKLLRKLSKMGQNMQHFMDHAPFSEKWGKQQENVPNGGDWGDKSGIYNSIPCYLTPPRVLETCVVETF